MASLERRTRTDPPATPKELTVSDTSLTIAPVDGDRPAAASISRATGRTALDYVWAVLRIMLGWVFLWTFLDKLFGLGYDTKTGWLDGNSPTSGFLDNAASGSIGHFYRDLAAGGDWVDWVYMLSFLAIGLGLILGVATRLAAIGGILWLLLLYTSMLWPDRNPFLDQHLIYIGILVGIIIVGPGSTLGLGRWWARTPIGRLSPILRG
jgi:thiosulfate dehydrogenase (quinone) large subunit